MGGFSFYDYHQDGYDYHQDGQLENADIYRGKELEGFSAPIPSDLLIMLTTIFSRCLNMPATSSGEMTLNSTQTFPEYFSSPNPLATVEIFAIIKLQEELPKGYVVADTDNKKFFLFNAI